MNITIKLTPHEYLNWLLLLLQDWSHGKIAEETAVEAVREVAKVLQWYGVIEHEQNQA